MTDGLRDRARLADRPFTYAEQGATRGELPAGYRHLRRAAVLGRGRACFERAAGRLMAWEMHQAAGVGVTASRPVAAPGVDLALRVGVGPVRVAAYCRVVYVTDEPDRRGFAYGTLVGHPESGEESFAVSIDAAGRVVLDIVAFSRPSTRLARLGGPVTRAVQARITDRYLRALTCRPGSNGESGP